MRVLFVIMLVLLGLLLNQYNKVPHFTEEMNSIICIQEEL